MLWNQAIRLNKLDMCLWNKDAPCDNKVKILKILEVLHFDFARPQMHVMVVKCEGPFVNLQPKFGYLQSQFGYCIITQTLSIALYK